MGGADDVEVRALGPADAEVSRRLGWEAFGMPAEADREAPAWPLRPGMRGFGAFDGDGALLARMIDREYDSWFGGAEVPTSGIAGVTVAAESRGRGLLTPLFRALLGEARGRGVAISTLFPTAPRIYRRFGYEVVGSLDTVELPTSAMAAVRPVGDGVTARRAGVADVPGIYAVYDDWASAQNGPLTRRGPSFPTTPEELVAAFTGVTVAVGEGGDVQGYALWSRGRGYGEPSRLDVTELVSTSAPAAAVLLRTLGSFATVTPTTHLRTSGGMTGDVLRLLLPSTDWQIVESEPYMLRIVDPAAALTARRFPRPVDADVTFTLADELLTDLDGGWRLRVHDGAATCERAEPSGPRLTGRGLALLYAGAQGSANLRMVGLLDGDETHDEVLDVLFGGRQVHIRDYF